MSSSVARRLLLPLLLGAALTGAAAENPQLQVPKGFVASVFHPGVGKGARHLAIRDNGDLFVTRRDGTLLALRDNDGDGSADLVSERKLPVTSGIRLHAGYLYFSDNLSVSRIRLDDQLLPQGAAETIVSGFIEQGSHATKDFAINAAGELFVNVGAPSNACQEADRTPGSPGLDPCPLLQRQAAIWRFDAAKPGQRQEDGVRYVTGIRNIVALDWNRDAEALYFVMHGRDQLSFLWPQYYSDADSARLPAEEFHRAIPGGNYGWPYTYVDPATGQRLQAPEYGGDGRKPAAANLYQPPLHAYPAHWAPNDLLLYQGTLFPERYRGGAFIAWHGSWNRAPLPQAGYRLTFQPMQAGKPAGAPEDFMTGFAGAQDIAKSSDALYRPEGLAMGPDGELYLSESVSGRIWQISYPAGAPQ
jgi:glucose/arabinose dehydrogenase